MEKSFWINAWKEGDIGFHQTEFNSKLSKYFSLLEAKEGDKIFVPLCGKTNDMVWLLNQNLKVRGVELYQGAILDFFKDNSFNYEKEKIKNFTLYRYKDLTIYHGDFFTFKEENEFDFIYDRASLVALPKEMRKDYATHLTKLIKKGGKYLLLTFEYNQEEREGPPFSVEEDEVHALYESAFKITLLEESMRHKPLKQKVYLLEKV